MDEILAAFDEELGPEAEEETEEASPVEEEPEQTEEAEQTDEEEPEVEVAEEEAEEEGADEEDEGGEEEGGQDEVEVTAEHDPAVQASLNRYGGDVDQPLRGAVELKVLMGRQSNEVAAARQRAVELEQILNEQQQLHGTTFLTGEQQQWVEEAVASGNPRAYVQGAMQQGEFDLARAVVREWSREDPYEAMRIGQVIEGQAQRAYAPQQQAETIDKGVLLGVLQQNYPEMAGYWGQMETLLTQLGPSHPTVQDAMGNDVEQAARGIVNLFEIARASSATVKEAKETVKRKQRKAADEVREGAVVSSAGTSRATSEKARSMLVTPGLTLEELDAEFEAAASK